ncbi:Metalloenzyme, LuxS/M16 peptidase-like protein [Tribonema minus]|uniref:Metalloenzyme, LuxS/M16 peptidase-like protein n=1 Tax=Tribonema minus TaxID=303371 RepID=A0A835ZGW9_9STRA|nr:Metalloenzyme, LuxS/M16 peptidase-like protein [Tribonema minus]
MEARANTGQKGARGGQQAAPPAAAAAPPAHPAYDLVSQDFVQEYGAATALYRHRKSGAEVLSVQIDDDNKVFGVTFRTPPEDSSGVPHILEHSVLCGSRKFPTKEPFVELLKGSLQTFLNAFTYPDRTCYPVASQNTKDFYNLIHVYLDAVLFPRAASDPLVMQQEGWHYELEDPAQPLAYKGVVFNEMKGVYSSPDALHGRARKQALFPDNTYGVDSGGDPQDIPNLTYDYFQAFHRRFYHPANSRVYFYGDDAVPERLELLDEYLREFDAADADPAASAIQWQKKRGAPWRHSARFPARADAARAHMVSVNWLLNDAPLTPRDKLTLSILNNLLVGNSAAVVRKALTDSGLGASVIGGGLSDELLQATWGIGLKGVAPEKVDEVEALILSTLAKCAEEGFEVSASMGHVEVASLELNSHDIWLYGGSPTEALHFEAPLAALKADLAAGVPVFQNLVKELLIDNGHRVTLEMQPDVGYEAETEAREKSKLEAVKASMTAQDIADVIAATKSLKDAQAREDSAEARAMLPTLALADLDKSVKTTPIDIGQVDGVTVVSHALPSSGILYADVGMDMTGIPLSEYPLLGLFSRLLLESGAGARDRVELSRHINTHTGGVYCSTVTGTRAGANGAVAAPDDVVGYLFLRGKAVSAKTPELLSIIRSVVREARLDSQQRAVEILKEMKARLEASVVGSGHSFAATRIDSRHALEPYLNEIGGGLSSLATVKANLAAAEEDWPALLARLEELRAAIFKRDNLIINLTGDQGVLDAAEQPVRDFIASMPESASVLAPASGAGWAKEAQFSPIRNEGFIVPTQVNYVGKGGRLFEPGEKAPGSFQVVSRYLRTGYLWDNVRVMGGAYGGFCNFNPTLGLFSFLSYRDPNLAKTLDVYDACADYLGDVHLTQEELERGVIGTIGAMDAPQSADARGFTSFKRYLVGITDEQRQRVRDEVLATTKADFAAFGDRLRAFNGSARAAVVGSRAALEAANEGRAGDAAFHVEDV